MAVRRALLALRPHGAFLPASASRHRLTCPRAVAAVSGDAGWARRVCRARRCGESGESGKRGRARVCVCVLFSSPRSSGWLHLRGGRRCVLSEVALSSTLSVGTELPGIVIGGMPLPLGGVLVGRGGPGRCSRAAAALLSMFMLVELSSQISLCFHRSQCMLLLAVVVKVCISSLLQLVGKPLGSSCVRLLLFC